ncbi:MAG: 4'-phosphopantetheinyl transferase superfamily protein [Polyangia bacterium]|jgi:4'-phosphopantetheinyl transferase EntD
MGAEIAFRLSLVHGRCVGVRIPAQVNEAVLAALVPDERTFVSTLAPGRHPSWVAGRLALREAFRDLGIGPGPILATRRGAPALPSDLVGSISHKRMLAVGLAARREGGASIGVDLETSPPAFASAHQAQSQARPDVRTRVLTHDELLRLESVPEENRRRTVILHFSLKEALYKAIDPLVGRHVAFHEASMTPLPDGSASIALALSEDDGSFFAVGSWTEVEDHFLTTARVQRQ